MKHKQSKGQTSFLRQNTLININYTHSLDSVLNGLGLSYSAFVSQFNSSSKEKKFAEVCKLSEPDIWKTTILPLPFRKLKIMHCVQQKRILDV
jgi:hypothetical protein